jgi:ribosomal protein S18 acetylase RimI-like enzyme
MYSIHPMTIADYDSVFEMMKKTPGVSIRDADSLEATARYLKRNPGLSFVAEAEGQVVGCIMSGHDGRRGYLQHLIVAPQYRNQGIGTALIEHCLTALGKEGIQKSHLDVFRTNTAAAAYWEKRGWTLRTDIDRFSLVRAGGANA